MEVTAETLKAMSQESAARDVALVRSAFGSRMGLLPGVDFSCDAVFVRKSLEYDVTACLALLPSGKFVDVEEKGSIEMPALDTGDYYLTVGLDGKSVEFERNEVPMVRPEYSFAIRAFDELGQVDEMPLLRLHVEGGEVSIDREYIVPCLQMSSDPRYAEARRKLIERMETVAGHPNLAPGSPSLSMRHNLYLLKSLRPEHRVDEFLVVTEEIAHAVRYFIPTPDSAEEVEIPAGSQYDIQRWLEWLDSFLVSAAQTLDGTVLQDNTVDYDELKEQLRKELYDTLQPELSQMLLDRMDALKSDIQTQISEALKDFISGEFRRQLHDELNAELSAELEQKLYSSLYSTLYDALFVPPKVEEDTYTPLI